MTDEISAEAARASTRHDPAAEAALAAANAKAAADLKAAAASAAADKAAAAAAAVDSAADAKAAALLAALLALSAENAAAEARAAAAEAAAAAELAAKTFVVGDVANDVLYATDKDDVIDGDAGNDTAVFTGRPQDYDVRQAADGSWTVRHVRGSAEGDTDTLRDIEKIAFEDGQTYHLTPKGLAFQTDIVLVFDETGSMGPALDRLKAGVTDIVQALFDDPGRDGRLGVVGFKDTAEADGMTVVRQSFTDQDSPSARAGTTQTTVAGLSIAGGGDAPETPFDGLLKALDGSTGTWRAGAGVQRIVVITDAAAKDGNLKQTVIDHAKAEGVEIFLIQLGIGGNTVDADLKQTVEATGGAVIDVGFNYDQIVPRLVEIIGKAPSGLAPIASDDAAAVAEGGTASGNVLANDSDADAGDVIRVTSITGPNGVGGPGSEMVGTYGVLTLQEDGSYSYRVTSTALGDGEQGRDVFTYTIGDGTGSGADVADLVVTVTGVNDPARLDRTPVRLGSAKPVAATKDQVQEAPSVTALRDGGFVVTWDAKTEDGKRFAIYAERFDASGTPSGPVIAVKALTEDKVARSSVTALSDGGFVVTFDAITAADGTGDVYAQRYDASGHALGGPVRVNETTERTQDVSSVIALSDGGYLVTWTSDQGVTGHDVYGRRYDGAGQPVGGEFRVNTETAQDQSSAAAAGLSDGGFVVTFTSIGQDGDGAGVYGQRYDAAGKPSGAAFQVNTDTASDQSSSTVTGLADGGFVVTWVSYGQDGDNYGVYGQRYDASGQRAGAEFQVNTYTAGVQSGASVHALSDGGFLVMWNSPLRDGHLYGIYGQRYDAAGMRVGEEFRASGDADAASYSTAWTAQLADGHLVAGWSEPFRSGVSVGSFELPSASGAVSEDGAVATVSGLVVLHDADADQAAFRAPAAGLLQGSCGVFSFDPASGRWSYTLDDARPTTQALSAGQVFAETLTVTSLDGTASEHISVLVTGTNDAPTATGEAIAAVEGESREGNVLLNDNDVDMSDRLVVVAVSGSTGAGAIGKELVGHYGALTLQEDGGYSYAASNTPLPAGKTATETFSYTVSDGHGGTATADLVVTVTGGNPPFGNSPGQLRGAVPSDVVPTVGDFDGDGAADLMWRDAGGTVDLLAARGGQGTPHAIGTIPAGWSIVAAADLDGNGTDDVLLHNTESGALGAWIMRNGAPADWRALGTLGSSTVAGTGDIDHDGTQDLLFFDGATRALDVLFQGKSGAGQRATLGTIAEGWAVAGVGDLDGRGFDDVLLFNAASRQVGAWQTTAGHVGGWYDYGRLQDGWEITGLGNFDGKGPDDVGFYQASTGRDGAWAMGQGRLSDWIVHPSHDDLDPIGAGRLSGTTDQILWHNAATGAVVTF